MPYSAMWQLRSPEKCQALQSSFLPKSIAMFCWRINSITQQQQQTIELRSNDSTIILTRHYAKNIHLPDSINICKLLIIDISSSAIIFWKTFLYFSTESLWELPLPARACISDLTSSAILKVKYFYASEASHKITKKSSLDKLHKQTSPQLTSEHTKVQSMLDDPSIY